MENQIEGRLMNLKQLGWFVMMVVLLVACGRHPSTSKHQLKTLVIHTAIFHEVLHFAGAVQPIRETTLTSPVDGILEKINYPFGQSVKKGAIAFVLNSTALQKQYNDALTDYLKAKDNFVMTETKFAGTDDLWKAGLIAKNNYISEMSNLNTSRITLMQARQRLFELLEKTDFQSSQELTRLNLAEFEKVQKALNGEHHLIQFKAPMQGVLLYPPLSGDMKTNRLTVGNTIKAGQALALIGDLSGIRVEIDIPEVDIDKVRPGVPAIVRGVAFKAHELHGKLISITSQASAGATGALPSFQAIIEVSPLDSEQQSWIKVGMSASVELVIDSQEQLMIPIAAVRTVHGENTVRLQMPDGTVKEHPVQTGTATASQVTILKGLKTGDVVVYE
jgi:HlyD family secretion protein